MGAVRARGRTQGRQCFEKSVCERQALVINRDGLLIETRLFDARSRNRWLIMAMTADAEEAPLETGRETGAGHV